MENILEFITVILWVIGIVFAEGGWKILAFFIPIYSYYLIVKKIMQKYGWA